MRCLLCTCECVPRYSIKHYLQTQLPHGYHSAFLSSQVAIRFDEILCLAKQKTALFIPNAIEVTTDKRKVRMYVRTVCIGPTLYIPLEAPNTHMHILAYVHVITHTYLHTVLCVHVCLAVILYCICMQCVQT